MRCLRTCFNYLNAIEATDRPINCKVGLKAVPVSVQRKYVYKRDEKLYSRDEVLALINNAKTPIKAFVLLGVNAAYGPADIGRLKVADIDFDNQWLGVMRGKTGVARGCWLWPETIAALHEAIQARPWTGRERLDCFVSLTRNRLPWWDAEAKRNPVQTAFKKLQQTAGIDKHAVGHYALRHTFRTIASDARDREAADYIMGHMDNTMSGNYRHGVDPQRVKAVCQFVRTWLYGEAK